MEIKIEKIENKNISEIRNLWEALNKLHYELSIHFKDHYNSFDFDDRMSHIKARDCFAVFVARHKSRPVGYCIASVEGTKGEIDSIYIEQEYRKSGMGDTLMARGEEWLRSKNISKIIVSVAEGNESVFGFYNRHGYCHRLTVFEKLKK